VEDSVPPWVDVSCATGSRVAYARNESGGGIRDLFAQWLGTPKVLGTAYIEGVFDSLTRFVGAQKDASIATHYAKVHVSG
jgi:hypothetical protein